MTREEAVEIILGGDALEDCSRCEGFGYLNESETARYYVNGIHVGNSVRTRTCPECLGGTNFIRPEYIKACHILGVHIPWSEPEKKS